MISSNNTVKRQVF